MTTPENNKSQNVHYAPRTVCRTIGLAADHAGFEMKEFIKTILDKQQIPYHDFGTYSTDRSDYPDFAHPLALAVENDDKCFGIAVCGTGNGMSMTLNKHQGIRAGLCWNEEITELIRKHNDANVLVLPGRFISEEEAEKCVNTFLSTPYEGGRHQQRIDKIPLK